MERNLHSLFNVITYVPHYITEFKNTWFSMPYLLALGVGDILNKPVITLFKKHRIHAQHSLSKKQRWKSLKDLYDVVETIPEVDGILIIDDIITTGSTLKILRNLLKRKGIESIHTLTLAKTPKWSEVV